MYLKNTALSFILINLLFVASLFGQTQNGITGPLSQKIDGIFEEWNKSGSPGCVVGIVGNDSLIYAKGYGQANLEYDIANSPESIYHMASVSKQFTAYAIVLLAKENKLNLDDDIRKYVSWFPDLKEKITIRHLLNHTSGIRDQWQLLILSGTRIDDVITQDHIIKVLSNQRALNSKPSDRFSYSNSNYTLLAEIVKSVSGTSFRKYTDSVIFKPLGMNQTHFHDDYTEIVKNRAYSYYPKSNGYTNSTLSYSNAGATSLFTNIHDMAKWVINLYDPKVGTISDIQTLTQKPKLNTGEVGDYAAGIVVNEFRGWKQYAHNGADAGYRTAVHVLPELKLGFIIFSNLGTFNMGKMWELANLFVQDKTPASLAVNPLAIDSSKAELANAAMTKRFTGAYTTDDGSQYKLAITGNKLYASRPGRTELLQPTKLDSFHVASNPNIKFVFQISKKGDTLLREIWPGGRNFVKFDPDFKPNQAQLKAYTGTYYSPELDTKFSIAIKENGLVMSNIKYEDIPLRFDGKDHLRADFWWLSHIKMLRSETGQIKGFEVNDSRIMHLNFDKIK